MRKVAAWIAIAVIAGMVGLGLTACGSAPSTVTAKFKCSKTVNNKQVIEYCVEDSNGTIFYYPWIYWRTLRLGTLERNGTRIADYAGNAGNDPLSDKDVPTHFKNAFHNVDESNNHSVVPAEHPEEAPVHVSVHVAE